MALGKDIEKVGGIRRREGRQIEAADSLLLLLEEIELAAGFALGK